MTSTYTKAVINCATNTIEHIPMTDEEIADYEKAQADYAELEAKQTAEAEQKAALKASAKAKLTAGEPLTDEEAAAIVI